MEKLKKDKRSYELTNQAEIHRKTISDEPKERHEALNQLRDNFAALIDKKQAWEDLHRLTMDMDSEVQLASGESLGSAFPHVPDKKKAWDDLHRLTRHVDSNVRFVAVGSIGSVLPYITDKKQAWEDLHQLTKDEDIYVRESANYSLGRVSIFKATKEESEEDLRKELENALGFFEKSSLETTFNPGRFCYLFYRSFYVMTFKEPSEAEVQKYITKAKSASEGSVSKKKLIEAVENLANALREAKGLRKKRLDIVKCDLNTYRRYCDRAAELMKITKKEAPLATEMLTRGLPIIDKRIKDLIGEIEEKTKNFCLDFSQTPLKNISRSAYGCIKGLKEVEYPIEVETRLNRLSTT